eukprot:CAMPEP_0179435850 /NCGR_PEP_ID=MMETSP0799-20121207/19893_1 /TAXON_ID=46947 /ORGANISM="Geminigera cryophila, Strain CCMP2564" /LENGTH=100 /DNA_ID=CAMNT_0021215499 /DNA_START=229 /DNA_END=528 /DNA_ORIENTATION=+
MPGASDWMPFWFRYRAPEVVEHIPTDDTWKAASSDKMQLPNVAICVSAPTHETHTQMKTRSVCMMRILTNAGTVAATLYGYQRAACQHGMRDARPPFRPA